MTQKIIPAYVSFEQAKWLKEKGFDVLTWYCYLKDRTVQFSSGDENDVDLYNHNLWDNYSMPEQWQVVEWLRVNHGIWICVNKSKDAEDNGWFHYYVDNKWSAKLYDTPQEAYSAAFDYILNSNLI
jgi:hypothetical protein